MYYYCILRRYILIFHGPSFKCFIDYTKVWIIIIIFLSTLKNKLAQKSSKKNDIFKFVKFFGVQSKVY